MNIFCLDSDPVQAAKFHCNKHVVKMIVETYQCLGSAVIRHGAQPQDMPLTAKGTPLKGGYHNHPSTRWVGDSRSNFNWTIQLGLELCREYTYRYDKRHSCQTGIEHLVNMSHFIPEGDLTQFSIAISPQQTCREHPDFDNLDPVSKYRLYYIYDKADFAQWSKREIPHWFTSTKKHNNGKTSISNH
jgi:hypothetical protein